MRFESLEARRTLAADFGSQAADYSIPDGAQTLGASEVSSGNRGAPFAEDLFNAAGISAADALEIEALRILKDIDAILDGNKAAALPEQGDENVDPMTFLGDGSSRPDLPGASPGDPAQMLEAMGETFRGAASHHSAWPSPGDSPDSPSHGPKRDPFERFGWVAQDRRGSHGDYSDDYVDEEGLHYVSRITVEGGRLYSET